MEKIKYILLLWVWVVMAGCESSDQDVTGPDSNAPAQFFVKMNETSSASRATSDIENIISKLKLNNDFIVDKSRIYILNNTTEDRNHMTYESFIAGEGKTIYTYQCKTGEVHTYPGTFPEYKGVYNTFDAIGDNKLTWGKIIPNGSSNYEFTAMYCPVDQTFKDGDAYPKPFNHVALDQRDPSVFAQQDLLVARTLTAYGEPIYLVFHHMLAMVVVRVTVPLFNPTDGSGFMENAVNYGALTSVFNTFRVGWNTNKTSGQALECEARKDIAREPEIKMYPIETTVDKEKNEQVYIFAAIIPGQTLGQSDTADLLGGGELLPIFRLYIKDANDVEKKYIFMENNADKGSQAMNVSKGCISVLDLRINRVNNEPIILTAEIIPWTHSYTDFTLEEVTGGE